MDIGQEISNHQRLESRSPEVRIIGECLMDAEVSHNCKGNQVDNPCGANGIGGIADPSRVDLLSGRLNEITALCQSTP